MSDLQEVALAPYEKNPTDPSIEGHYRVKVKLGDQEERDWSFDDLRKYDRANHSNLAGKAKDLATYMEASKAVLPMLKDGTWRYALEDALDELVAGETFLKWLLFYSACSSGLKDRRLHLLTLGDSQQGKSYTQEQVGFNFCSDILLYASAMSAKAVYYEAAAKDNPHLYEHKILLVDEFKDLSDSTKATIKSITSNGKVRITNKTVDKDRQYVEQTLEGMPVVWANTAEAFEDRENQISNRYLKVNVDESQDQTRRIEGFQKEKEALGPFRNAQTAVPNGRAIITKILEEKDFEVVNLFAYGLEQDGRRARNIFPMFSTLVASITYANRFQRQRIDLLDGRKVLFATLTDNEEAACIWAHYNGTQTTGVADRHIRLLNSMLEGEEYSVEDATAAYNMAFPQKQISTKTCADYLSELAGKNLVISRRDEGSRRYFYSKLSCQLPKNSQLIIGKDYRSNPELLDEALDELKEHASRFLNYVDAEFEVLRHTLIDPPTEHLLLLQWGEGECTPSNPEPEGEQVLLETKVREVHDVLRRGPLTLEQVRVLFPNLVSTVSAMKERGDLTANLAGALYFR